MTVSELHIPPDGWKPIKEAFLTTDIPKFNNGHIVTYFVTHCVIDGLPSEDFKVARNYSYVASTTVINNAAASQLPDTKRLATGL